MVALRARPVAPPMVAVPSASVDIATTWLALDAGLAAGAPLWRQGPFQRVMAASDSIDDLEHEIAESAESLDSLLQVMSTAECPAGSSGAPPPPPPPPPPPVHVGPTVRPQTGGGDKPCQALAGTGFTTRFSSRPNKVLGQEHYSTGTIVTLHCNGGLHPTLVNNMGNPMPMACRDGAWTTETGRVTQCVSAPSPPYTGGGGH